MITLKGKHTVTEIEGVRCSVVGTGITEGRKDFLKELLSLNGFEVKAEKEKAKDGTLLETWILGVTDIHFNPVIAVYAHRLRRNDGTEVTPAYWEQWNAPTDVPYWHLQNIS
jgi:hypothetical protein